MAAVKTKFILTLPCDSPLLADNFVERFIDSHNREQAQVCVAHDGERLQPVYALIDIGLLDDLKRFLQSGERKIDRWYAQYSFASVDFSTATTMFENINTPEDQQPLVLSAHAVDAIAGYMWLNDLQGEGKLFYTTERLTSEMVIKVALMEIPVLLSRSGITRMGLEIAQKVGVTLIARAKGRHFMVYHGREFIEFDAVPEVRHVRSRARS